MSILSTWICIFAEFRCSCFSLHLNAEVLFGNPCNIWCFSKLQQYFRFLFGFRCIGCFAVPFGETLSRGTCRAGLHSGVFHFKLASEPRVLLLKFLQYACYEHVDCLNLHFGRVQMLLLFTASERGGIPGKSPQMKVIQWVAAVFSVLSGFRCRAL